jgi:hypothetical protein
MSFEASKMAELGIPDWRDPTAYPKPANLSLSDWRWEFLRRNPQYRQDYNRPDSSFEDESKDRYFERTYMMCNGVDPRLSTLDYLKLTQGQLFHSEHFDVFVGSRNYSSMYAPSKEEINRILCHCSFYDLSFRVDPLQPLEPQFKVIKEISRSSQRSLRKKVLNPRMRKDNWPLYLRVIDARDCKATYTKIARICLKHEDQFGAIGAVRDLFKQASKLRDHWPFASVVL